MKGGVVLALGVARALAAAPGDVRRAGGAAGHRRGVAHGAVRARAAVRAATTPACASRPASDARRARRGWSCAARPPGRCGCSPPGAPSHSGSAPDQRPQRAAGAGRAPPGRWPTLHDPTGPEQLSVVPDRDALGRGVQRRPGRRRADLRPARPPAGGVRGGAGRGPGRARRGRARGPDGARVAGDGLRGGHRRAARPGLGAARAARSSACRAAAPATPATSPTRSR